MTRTLEPVPIPLRLRDPPLRDSPESPPYKRARVSRDPGLVASRAGHQFSFPGNEPPQQVGSRISSDACAQQGRNPSPEQNWHRVENGGTPDPRSDNSFVDDLLEDLLQSGVIRRTSADTDEGGFSPTPSSQVSTSKREPRTSQDQSTKSKNALELSIPANLSAGRHTADKVFKRYQLSLCVRWQVSIEKWHAGM